MRRREFLGLIGGALSWPHVAGAQQAMPVIGYLHGQSPTGLAHLFTAFHKGLGSLGYIDGQNVKIEYRWAEGHSDRLPSLASELVQRQVVLIVSTGNSGRFAKNATSTIPIVSTFGGDPVRLGFVNSLNRPTGNVTGVSVVTSDLEAKRIELMHELMPKAALIGVLLDANFADAGGQLQQVQRSARTIGQRIEAIQVRNASDIDAAFAKFNNAKVSGLVVAGSPLFIVRREQIVTLAARHQIPAIYENRETVIGGGLMSYGTSIPEVYRQIGIYAGRILQGAKVSELPVVQATKVDITVNLKVAKVLGLDIPTSILLRANEVIE